MPNNVSTKLIEQAGDKAFKSRKLAMVAAWRTWYHSIIESMAAQVKREGLEPDMVVSSELGALQNELDHCEQVGTALFGFMNDYNSDDAE